MSACSFDRLLHFVDKKLDLNGELDVYDHLDRCDICRDAVYQLSRDRDDSLFIHPAYLVILPSAPPRAWVGSGSNGSGR
jgi:hypothetical protein